MHTLRYLGHVVVVTGRQKVRSVNEKLTSARRPILLRRTKKQYLAAMTATVAGAPLPSNSDVASVAIATHVRTAKTADGDQVKITL